jgi:hypothetical protein
MEGSTVQQLPAVILKTARHDKITKRTGYGL